MALTRQLRGRTVDERFDGLNRSERNEAKLFLVAMLPFLAAVLWVPKWSEASFWHKSLTILATIWGVSVFLVGCLHIFRCLMRISVRSGEDSLD